MVRSASLSALAAAAVLVSPALALAADDAHGAHAQTGAIASLPQGIATAITALVVFVIVFAVLSFKVWPVIAKGLDDRSSKIRSEIEAAELAQQQARDALRQYEKSLAQARAEAQKMLDDAKLQQQAISADLKAKADIDLNAMRERAKRDIDAAKRAAIAEIYTEASSMATSIASKILQREIRPQDQQRLVDESLAQFQTVHNN